MESIIAEIMNVMFNINHIYYIICKHYRNSSNLNEVKYRFKNHFIKKIKGTTNGEI